MNWSNIIEVMENYAIKRDVTSCEDAYFMATHMPFSQLEVIAGGSISTPPDLLSEEKIYQKFIVNQNNQHEMIIVRGSNGSGKSHLVRWLKARYENDSKNYNPDIEKIVFLRRLGNTIRGAISQLLSEDLILDETIAQKFNKFIGAVDSQDEEEFKTTIYHAYISHVMNDKSGKFYMPVLCRDIASFLSDQRVWEQLTRPDGAINNCYHAIVSSSDTVFGGEASFSAADFDFSRSLCKKIITQGSQEAQTILEQIDKMPEEIDKLVKYLNQFTPKVIQSCADISSESAQTVFVELRKTLKKQGKNLTIFIEDFTAFTGIDAELITALAAEDGGIYSDLCRVTSVIGITDGYYGQFKDNFKDRVTYQINVAERSYGSDTFLLEMAARYINAIYCDPDKIREWYKMGGIPKHLPITEFSPVYDWDSIDINGSYATLFPFNKQSILRLYQKLETRTPRFFLLNVIRDQLKAYVDGKIYGNLWNFPTNTHILSNVEMDDVHISHIDNQINISDKDKNRLKTVFGIWGNSTSLTGDTTIGTVPTKFLDDIGLGMYEGVSGSPINEPSQINGRESNKLLKSNNEKDQQTNVIKPISPKERQYHKLRDDLSAWYDNKTVLGYSADFRKWVEKFISNSINWQAEGIPAYIVQQRIRDVSFIYICDQKQTGSEENAFVVLERNTESRDVLLGLNEFNYYGGWNFKGAEYFQLKLITWVERNKDSIKYAICGYSDSPKDFPILRWSVAVSFIVSCVLGTVNKTKNSIEIAKNLFAPTNYQSYSERINTDWNKVAQRIKNDKSDYDTIYSLFTNSFNTFMGVVGSTSGGSTTFYRSAEIISIIEDLQMAHWNIENELSEYKHRSKQLMLPVQKLKDLYPHLKLIVKSEKEVTHLQIENLEKLLGDKLSESLLVDIFNSITTMYTSFNAGHIAYDTELKAKFEKDAPIQQAKELMKIYTALNEAFEEDNIMDQLVFFSENPLKKITELISNLSEIERIAFNEKEKAEKLIRDNQWNIDQQILDNAVLEMKRIYKFVDSMEV